MGRRLTSGELEQRAAQAKAREQYYYNKNSNPETFNATVEDLPRRTVGYKSSTKRVNALSAKYAILASQSALEFFESTPVTDTSAVGKLQLVYATATINQDYTPVTKFSPARIKAVVGGTKTAVSTPWGSRYIKYSANATGSARNSYTAPISGAGTLVTEVEVLDAAEVILNSEGFKAKVKANGRVWFEPEAEGAVLYRGE